MSKLSNFTQLKGVKKLTPKQKMAVQGGDLSYLNNTNSPPKQNIINWGKPKG